ncbi:hypothetical protein LCGC14_2883950, partial [marine sediment metagenome]
VQGVWAGARRGLKVPDEYWQRVERHWIRQQQVDGGWGYIRREGMPKTQTYGSMTAAGLATMYICSNALHRRRYARPQAPEYKPIAEALAWLDKHFDAGHNPRKGVHYYYPWLHAMFRVGRWGGYKHFRGQSWYAQCLAEILDRNTQRDAAATEELHELGWLQKPGYMAATAAEALGWIATPQAEQVLIASFSKLRDFWDYTFNNGDHDWLRGCHSSVVHWRIIEALDAIGSQQVHDLVPDILRSVPIDPDRALLFESDSYEATVARIVQRSGMAVPVLESCLAVLGDPDARPQDGLLDAVSASPPATEVKPHDRETRAAQIASVVVLDDRSADRIRAALNRYRPLPPSRKRSWVCFFLARALGKVRDGRSVATLLDVLRRDPTEVSLGLE